MNDGWALHSRFSHGRRDAVVTHHDTFVRAIDAASRLWRQGRQPSSIHGPTGERVPKSDVEAAIKVLYELEARCETCKRADCNRLPRALAKHAHLPWVEFLEAAASECSRQSED